MSGLNRRVLVVLGLAGMRDRLFTLDPFTNYNFSGGWFVGMAPIVIVSELSGGAKRATAMTAIAVVDGIFGFLNVGYLAGLSVLRVRPVQHARS